MMAGRGKTQIFIPASASGVGNGLWQIYIEIITSAGFGFFNYP